MNMMMILFKNMSYMNIPHMNTILSHKEKGFISQRKMDEVRAMNKIEVELSQEKIDFINETY